MKERPRDVGPVGSDFGATTPNIRVTETAAQAERPAALPPQEPRPPQRPASQRRIPVWVWLAGGGVLLALIAVAVLLFYFLLSDPGFTMVVRGAPPGSDVHVDNISRGVTSADGSIRVSGLKSGKRLVRVSHDGYADFNTSVSGKDGDVRTVVAQLTPTEAPKTSSLPNEVDYNGPMVLIPAGEFIMGDDTHNPDEKPAHSATLPDFYIDKFEVTNEQYKKFCDERGRSYPSNPWWDEKYFEKSPKSPVVGVSFDEAKAYAEWAGKRLPTEAEWEKAASWGPGAQKKRQWPWGDAPAQGRANINSKRTVNVGKYANGASAYGVHDMAGNVAEWVDSFYQAYEGNQTSNPNFGTQNRVVRGGTYRSDLNDARTTRRFYHSPELNESEKNNRAFLIGFRCAISADDQRLQERLRARAQ
ncbi:MAG TPA: SUMF1/EgtB/PvdO family nonheme iron enzyme [Pyrinomonadaceae bacterium]|nr:SUMF1/EgtB/PvdO family nonheme iron enzyme [Pyrinomonadaceae bacterium]